MGNLAGGEILIVLIAALIFLGPKRLPEAARQIGKAMAELRRMSNDLQAEVREAMAEPVPPEVPYPVPPEPDVADTAANADASGTSEPRESSDPPAEPADRQE